MNIRSMVVVGAGQMGSGIAQTAAARGFAVTLYDIDRAATDRGMASIGHSLSRFVKKGRLTEEQKSACLSLISPSTDMSAAAGADFVIEAAPERPDIKRAIFKELDRLCPPHAILATNTSSLPITDIAAATKRPESVIGMHFMNPVPVMPLVEVIRGLATSDEVCARVMAFAKELGKSAVEVQDFPGFASNRILMLMINEAIFAVYEGVAEPDAIDRVMKLGMNHPMGPLELADFIGLDTCLAIMETLAQGFGDSKYRPCPLLRKYVAAGWLGRKTGRGFYSYEQQSG
ncbi:3-hydroxybutyryl-CoA dehydrogenase [Paenibacillus contaminans]|uniref:3-hydroxybutyryl-CoA dehydrogenase n=1 Tax=Paenibacillus contaminans TaxID=450362 RepID=A0A329MTC6_9BACL|nr:3-hydroxybutyryl-CoA dehydrogenase [Paenibacillus contaminans]RAV22842.1 3-hydroxybutyryl-CoA dehydrogenase [Paenibacillus contaminans]